MNKRILFSIIIALGIVTCIILALEDVFSGSQMILGFVFFLPISFFVTHARHPLVMFVMVIPALLLIYFGWKYSWSGLIPGGILGVGTTALISFGWINPHKPFSRKEYTEKMSGKA